jgi:hypothetical protein
MYQRNRLGYGMALAALLGAGLFVWSRSNPASAQNGGVSVSQQEFSTSSGNGFATGRASAGGSTSGGGSNFGSGGGNGFGGVMSGGSAIAANAEFVYVLRGNTVVQMRAEDLTVVKTQELPGAGGSGTTTRRSGGTGLGGQIR